MKILVVSDLHSHHSIVEKLSAIDDFEKVDFIIDCGDLTHFGNIQSAEEMLVKLTALRKPVLFVPGNCDPKELANRNVVEGAQNVHGRCVRIGEFNILGVGGSPYTPFSTPFELAEEEIEEIVYHSYKEQDYKQRLILVSHSPPSDTRTDVTSSGTHVGSRAIREFIIRTKPILVFCGHIHEARGTDYLEGSLIVNPGLGHLGFYAIVAVNGDPSVKLKSLK
ncbi:MAG: uncharacterized protein QG670_1120 [Thermoproteota archaeon]|nr:uncharacterized protein [Thermoproteota archaeon]